MLFRSSGSRPACVRAVMWRTLGLALVIGLLPSMVSGQVVVEELEVHFRPTGDSLISRLIPVRNELTRPQQVRLSLGDWYRDSLGTNVFAEANSTPNSCGSRLQIFPETFQIAPGQLTYVRVSYTPSDSMPGCWGLVMIETVNPPRSVNATEGSFLTIEIRTAVKVYVHQRNAVARGVIESAELGVFERRPDPRAASGVTVPVRETVVRYANTGTAHLRVKTTLEIRDAEARLVRTVAGKEYYMTPGAVVNMHHVIPADLPSGEYIAILLLDHGGDEISAAQVDFRIP